MGFFGILRDFSGFFGIFWDFFQESVRKFFEYFVVYTNIDYMTSNLEANAFDVRIFFPRY